MARIIDLLQLLLSLSVIFLSVAKNIRVASFDRSSFPADFVFGTATSAYQIEGAASEGGRGPSIWDTFTLEHPDKIRDGSNGNVAIDSYHHFERDIRLLNDLGTDAYRFSISWSRILPNGTLSGGINKEGVQYYNNIINKLKSYDIEPYVTIFHFDVPQALEDAYGGFLCPRIVEDFKNYAELCFKLFGDRVKHWITINEPWTSSYFGYGSGIHAPGRCSPWEIGKCSNGDSGREPYIVAHNQLLAHAAVVKLYRDKYKASDKGMIGITIACNWFLPYSESESDRKAANRAIDFMIGWFMDPLTQGEYPFMMRSIVGDRLPHFTAEQSEMVRGSFDFLGINYYSTSYVRSSSSSVSNYLTGSNFSCTTDPQTDVTGERDGIPIGPQAASDWLHVYPPGIREMLLHLKNKYNNPSLYITENGFDEFNNDTLSLEESLNDEVRIDYFRDHLQFLQRATSEGVNLKGYFSWSLLDSYEWSDGYTLRFGLYYVDYKNMKRYPKRSALWFRKFLKKEGHAST